jgi:hypothetical protein
MTLTPKQKLIGAPAAFYIIVLIDRFLISAVVPSLSGLIKIDWDIVLLHYPIPMAQFGLVTVLIVFYGILALSLLPFRHLFSASAWKDATLRWFRFFRVSLVIPVAMIAGSFLYLLFKQYCPALIQTILESFGFSFTPIVGGTTWAKLDGSLATLAGLLVGVWIVNRYYKRHL